MVRAAPARSHAGILGAGVVALLAVAAVLCAFAHTACFVLVVIVLLLIAVSVVPSRYLSGVLCGATLLAGLNVVPGPDLSVLTVGAGVHAQDAVVAILAVALFVRGARQGFARLRAVPLGGALIATCIVSAAWWIVTLVRTAQLPYSSVTHSINFGRDLLFISILAPLLVEACAESNFRRGVLATISGWSILLAVVYVLASVTGVSASFVLHPNEILQQGSLTRQYSPAQYVADVMVPFGLAAMLFAADPRVRRAGGVVAAFNAVSLVVSLTRGQYLATGLALLVVGILVARGPGLRRARRILLRALVLAAVCIGGLFAFAAHSEEAHAIASIGSRLGTIFEIAQGNAQATSTLSARSAELQASEQRLGNQWLLGLGFIDPRDQFDPALSEGSIRNSDLGLFNVVMTEGVVGTILYYAPLFVVLLALGLEARRRASWEVLGSLVGLLSGLLGSVTLVVLFSPSGCVSIALAIGIGLGASEYPAVAPRRRTVPATGRGFHAVASGTAA